jgi:hypothetical protein
MNLLSVGRSIKNPRELHLPAARLRDVLHIPIEELRNLLRRVELLTINSSFVQTPSGAK